MSGSSGLRRRILACVLGLVVHLPVHAQETTDGRGVDPTRDCGAYCLGIVFELLGYPTLAFAELRAAAALDEQGLTNLLALERAVRKAGLSTYSTPPSAACPAHVTIAPLSVNLGRQGAYHFVVVQPKGDGSCVVYCPPCWVYETKWQDIRLRIGPAMIGCVPPGDGSGTSSLRILGGALLTMATFLVAGAWIGRKRGASALIPLLLCLCVSCREGGTDGLIRVEPSAFLDLGVVPAGATRASFRLVNDGAEPVRLIRTSTSCSCAVVAPSPPVEVPPGQGIDAQVEINVLPNEVRTVVLLYAFDGRAPIPVQVSLRGVLSGVTHDPLHRLPTAAPGERVPFRLSFSVRPEAVPLLLGEDRGVQEKWDVVEVGPVALMSHGRREIPDHPGALEFWVEGEAVSRLSVSGETRVTCTIGKVRIPFTVFWAFAPPAKVTPSILVLALTGETYRGEFTVQPEDGFALKTIDTPEGSVSCEAHATDGTWSVQVSAPRSWASGTGHTRVTINLENQHGVRRSFAYTIACAP